MNIQIALRREKSVLACCPRFGILFSTLTLEFFEIYRNRTLELLKHFADLIGTVFWRRNFLNHDSTPVAWDVLTKNKIITAHALAILEASFTDSMENFKRQTKIKNLFTGYPPSDSTKQETEIYQVRLKLLK